MCTSINLRHGTESWKPYFLDTSKLLEKTQLKMSRNLFKLILFANLDKATIRPTCCEVSHPKLLFLGDMDDYISLTDVPKR